MKLVNRIKNWFYSEQVNQLKLQLDASDDLNKQLNKELDKFCKDQGLLLIEKNQIREELTKLQSIDSQWKTLYLITKNEQKNTLKFLETIHESIENEIVGASATIDSLLEPK